MKPTPIIAEIGLAHEGSLGQAVAYINAAAEIGVEVVKFQIHFGDHESTRHESFRVQFSKQDKSRSEYWIRTGFSEESWGYLKQYADSKGIIFSASAFSMKALNLLLKLNVKMIKIGSGDLLNEELAEGLQDFDGLVLASTGLATYDDIEIALVNFSANREKNNLILMQCTSKYPTDLEESGATSIGGLEARFNVPFGFSDHTKGTSAAMVSIVHGAKIVEKHVNFDLRMFGPDTSSSVTFTDMEKLVQFRNDFEKMDIRFNKDVIANELIEIKKLFGRSLCLAKDLKKGHVLSREDLVLKKPAVGEFSWKDLDKIIGKRLKTDFESNDFLTSAVLDG
jgi:N-acetylneuraminate synthase